MPEVVLGIAIESRDRIMMPYTLLITWCESVGVAKR